MIYISNRLDGTQQSISILLNNTFQNLEVITATHSEDCVDMVFKVICHYYFPTCGNITHLHLPSPLCQEDCSYVQNNCQATWTAAQVAFTDTLFISCDDISQLLVPNCCTGAGIISSGTSTSNNESTENQAVILGTVLGVLFFVISVAVVAGIVLAFKYLRKSKKKQLMKIHLDIMAT